ncbi:ROK family transcriptional regulator [Thermogemmatispora sp.]|uniref:ROK family transcriptional regulator n=1 Tax=Thermogemmatispora sp. TaxID=1968838 RepID=UPI001D8E07C6|nr:ROK family transcriptional regulator [Thermogemmatispora sp.]MBX5451765.1 ROK family transcriptional regulator [Thermogemmatispora sp.]
MERAIHSLLAEMRAREGRQEEAASASALRGADLHRIRQFNRLLVLNYIREHGPLARVMLAQRLGLSRTTVSSIVDALLREGLVREGHLLDATPRGGRRAILVHFNTDAGRILGLDVGRTHLKMVLTNLAPEIVAQRSLPLDTERGPEECLALLVNEVRQFLAEQGVSWESLLGIGLGIPGPLSPDLRRLSSPPHMPGWDDVDLWQRLQAEFPCPLYIDNDANMGALGESRCGAGRGVGQMAYIKVGTGIGGGLIIDGRIYRGHQGSAGELGHLSIDENGPPCVCGNRGCLETLAGARAIVADACRGESLRRKLAQEGREAELPTPALAARAQAGTVDIGHVIEAARQGDAASIAAIERAGERIGLALAGLVNLLNPAVIVLDGGVARAGELLLKPLRRVTAAASLPAAWKGTQILPSALGGNAIALGAVLTVLDAAFSLPASALFASVSAVPAAAPGSTAGADAAPSSPA